MVVFEQYPHTITSQVPAVQVDPFQDANGDWIIPAPGLINTISSIGRAAPNGKGNVIKTQDGVVISYDHLIYLPLESPDFAINAEVVINNIGTGFVKRFFRGQLNCQMWV